MATVASPDLVFGGDLMIQLYVELPSGVDVQNGFTEVGRWIDRPLDIGFRIELENRLADRVDLVRRDLVENRHSVDYIGELVVGTRSGGSLVSRARVVDAADVGRICREVAATLRISGDDRFQGLGILLAYLFEIDKKECLVLLDRAAQGEAILIPHVAGFLAGIEEVAGISRRSLSVPPAAAVKLVPSLLQHHVHDRAAVVAKLGGKAVVLDLELLRDLDRGLKINVGVAPLALFRRADWTP